MGCIYLEENLEEIIRLIYLVNLDRLSLSIIVLLISKILNSWAKLLKDIVFLKYLGLESAFYELYVHFSINQFQLVSEFNVI